MEMYRIMTTDLEGKTYTYRIVHSTYAHAKEIARKLTEAHGATYWVAA